MEPPEAPSLDIIPIKQESALVTDETLSLTDAVEDSVDAGEPPPEQPTPPPPQENAAPPQDGQTTPSAAMDQDSAGSPTTGDDPPATNSWTNVKCVFCDQVLTSAESPKLLECLHASCSSCIRSKLNEPSQESADVVEVNTVACIVCNVLCSTTTIIDNQFLLELCNETESGAQADLNKSLSDLKCSSCQDSAPATSWCVECAEYICHDCVQAHQRLKITKEHTIKSKEEAEMHSQSLASTNVNKNFFCNIHPQEQLTLFCETCDRLTCRDCQLIDHRDHKYKFSHEIAAESRNFISSLLSDVSYKRVLLKSATKVIEDRQVQIMEKKTALLQEITQMVHKLTKAIIQRGKLLAGRLNEVCDAKQKTLTEKKLALEQLSLVTDHCIDFVNNAVNKGSDMALLFSKRQITQHLQRIKSRRADIPNPEIPVRIHLATDKVSDLIRVLGAFGNVVVDGRVYPSGQAHGPNQGTGPGPGPANPPATSAERVHMNQAPATVSQAHIGHHNAQGGTPGAPPPPPPPQQGYVSPQSYFPPGSSLRQPSPMGQPGPPRAATPPQSRHLMPPQVARNLNMLRHPISHHPQNIGLMRTHHQQVTSSTHPIVDGGNLTLQSMLSPRGAGPMPPQGGRIPYPQVGPTVQNVHRAQRDPFSHGQQINTARYQQLQDTMVPPHAYQRQHSHPPPHPPHPPHPPQQHPPQQQQQQQQHSLHYGQQMGPYHTGTVQGPAAAAAAAAAVAAVAAGVTVSTAQAGQLAWGPSRGQSPHSSGHNTGQHQWHIPQHAAGSSHSTGRAGQHSHHTDDNSFKITLKTQVSPQQQASNQHPSLHNQSGPNTPAVSITAAPVPGAIPIKQSSSHSGQSGGNHSHNNSNGTHSTHSSHSSSRSSSNSSASAATIGPVPNVSVTNVGSGASVGTGSNAAGRLSTYAVSSSAPKTPSPSLMKAEDVERTLDKYCMESVSDLMATIAKLDSNGIVVIPETPQQQQQQPPAATGDSPQVDSSTGDARHQEAAKNGVDAEPQKDDPNEDWCAVCMDGGELVCCDKCPKVFHMHCHIPSLEALPDDTWQCLLCTDLSEVLDGLSGTPPEQHTTELTPAEVKVARRIVLELYCQYEPSLPFREVVGPEVIAYHDMIEHPMSLEIIRNKLDSTHPDHYTDLRQVISDVRLIFKNAYLFNQKDSPVYSDSKTLEEFFDHLIQKWLPSYAYDIEAPLSDASHRNENGAAAGSDEEEDEEEVSPPAKRFRRIISE